jgi:hypothetical protein
VEVEGAGAGEAPQRGVIEVRVRAGSVSVTPGAEPMMVTAILMALR